MRRTNLALRTLLLVAAALPLVAGLGNAEGHGKPKFTVADDIGLTYFNDTDAVTFSPDGRYFIVLSQRGNLDLDRPESSLRLYVAEDVKRFLMGQNSSGELPAYWRVNKSTYKEGPMITSVRWLSDSTGFAFLSKSPAGNDQLFFADVQAKTLQPLTPEEQQVTAFDVRSRSQFAYCVLSPAIRQKARDEVNAPVTVGTARSFDSLIFPDESGSRNIWVNDLSELWVVFDGKQFRVMDPKSGQPIPIHLEGQRALALSPNGRSVVTALTVSDVPPEWETLYQPPIPASRYRLKAGQQSVDGFRGQRDVSEYVQIDLASGKVKPLTHAPIGNAVGWWAVSRASWSSDGQSVVLSGTFLPAESQGLSEAPNGPCVAVVDLLTRRLFCLERIKPRSMVSRYPGWALLSDVRFVPGKSEVIIRYEGVDGGLDRSTTYVRLEDGSWKVSPARAATVKNTFDVFVKQGPNVPPLLVAADRSNKMSRVIWDPNPQLQGIEMSEASVIKWKDKAERNWVGGLYKPPDYIQGKRYPLVIQTHGFDEQEFRPSGSFPTAFAAQELAAAGFAVLQVRDCPIRSTPEEGPCQVAGYEAAVEKLAADGLVDPDHVGIVGFSRTCFYVLEFLTTSMLHFGAASITDGVNEGYLQYLMSVDSGGNFSAHSTEAIMDARPFGSGLQRWLKQSPEFNMDKVSTPLQVVALGRRSVVSMWEPYATLRYLNKPVDFVVLNSDEHVLTNPSARMISQGGTVDWFRFWLKDEEDANPAKAAQYARWRELRKMQEENEGKAAAAKN